MESVLRELFFGNIIPMEDGSRITEEVKVKQEEYRQLFEPFEEKMKALGLLKEYEDVGDARVLRDLELEAGLFSSAFCLGARVMLEVLNPHMVF